MTQNTKTVLITGASKGIGKATAELFASRGWNVAATMRSPQFSDFSDSNGRIRTFQLDVTDTDSVATAIEDAKSRFGTIDVVVNNAGFGRTGPFEALSDEEMRAHFDTNVFGAMSVIREILPHMRANGSGRIINVTSMCGRMTLPLLSAYCATKWALDGFSEALSFEVKSLGIKVKIIEPGVINTEFFDTANLCATKPGLDAYDGYVERVLPNIIAWQENAPGPEVVARSIWTAATDIWPRLRYHPKALFAIAPRGFVPGNLYVRAIRRLMNAW